MNMEGIVSKRLEAPYRSGRGDFWTKAKCRPGQEVVIGGWWGDDRTLRSIMVGVYRDGDAAGLYGQASAPALMQRQCGTNCCVALTPLKRAKSPFAAAGTVPRAREIQWVEPKLVAEIAYSNLTRDGLLRQASFKALRADKPARDIVWEKPNATPDEPRSAMEENADGAENLTKRAAKCGARSLPL